MLLTGAASRKAAQKEPGIGVATEWGNANGTASAISDNGGSGNRGRGAARSASVDRQLDAGDTLLLGGSSGDASGGDQDGEGGGELHFDD